MWISVVADGIIAILLGVTIFYCFLVNRKLQALRSGKDELKGVIEGLAVATANAQSSIEQLKHAGRDVIGSLDRGVRDGRVLADELTLMIEAGNNLADRLEGGRKTAGTKATPIENSKKTIPTTFPSGPSSDSQSDINPSSQGDELGDLESELLKALRRAR